MRSASLKYEVRSFSENWSGHGPHRIAISTNVIKKLFYTVVFLTCAITCGLQIKALIDKYNTYPVNTIIEILHKTLDFPAVTICNKNVIKVSMLPTGGRDVANIVNIRREAIKKDQEFDPLPTDSYQKTGRTTRASDQKTGRTTRASNQKTGRTTRASDQKTGRTTRASNQKTGRTTRASDQKPGRTNHTSYQTTTPVYPNTGNTGGKSAVYTKNYTWNSGTKKYYNPKAQNELFNMSSSKEFYNYAGPISTLSQRRRSPEWELGLKVSLVLLKVNISTRFTMGHQLEDMLQSCTINGESCSAQNFTMFYNVVYGNCYTFNGFGTANGVRTYKAGPLLGLSMDLLVEQDEYVPSLSRSAGIRMLVHHPFDFPFPEDSGIDLAPGKVSSVGMKLRIVEKIGEPYTKCTTGSDVPIAYEGNYTVEACQKTCLQSIIVRLCNCSDTRYSSAKRFRAGPCDQPDYQCIQMATAKYSKVVTDKCDCPQACRMHVYQQTISTSHFPSAASQEELMNILRRRSTRLKEILNSSVDVGLNLLQVQVYYETLQYEKITEIPSFEFLTLMSDIGGQMGLFVGCSVITIVEVIELVGNLFWIIVLPLCTRKKHPPLNRKIAPE